MDSSFIKVSTIPLNLRFYPLEDTPLFYASPSKKNIPSANSDATLVKCMSAHGLHDRGERVSRELTSKQWFSVEVVWPLPGDI